VFGSLVLYILRFMGGGVCHQLPARSLQVAGQTLPLCARCTGTHLGAMIGLLTVLLHGRARASLLPRWPVLLLCGLFFLAWGIDGLNSYLALFPGAPYLYEPANPLRLLTGLLEGLSLTLVIWPVVAFTLWRHPKPVPVVSLPEFAASVLAGVAVVVLLSFHLPGLLYLGGVVSILGLLTLFALLNALLLVVALRREGTLDTSRQALRLLAGTCLLGAGELVLLSLLRHWLLRL